FTAVSELGSMTLGAAATGIPQPVASRRIAGLEEQFGARLLERTGRGVSLTPFGRDMLASATRLVELADEMMLDADKRSEEHTSELQSRFDLVCRLLLEKKKIN